ncbi:MAG: VOC family protein [Bacteroidetes bacterium]|nr:VOC family protein [Bacteroidota bacterium]
MKSMNVYLFFNGNCEEAMNFYKKCLGGDLTLMRYKEGPMETTEESKEKIMHAELRMDGIHLMASDGEVGKKLLVGQNVNLSINFDTKGEQEEVFNMLADGGNITMKLEDVFWGAKFGSLTDKFGVNWMFNYDKPEAQN